MFSSFVQNPIWLTLEVLPTLLLCVCRTPSLGSGMLFAVVQSEKYFHFPKLRSVWLTLEVPLTLLMRVCRTCSLCRMCVFSNGTIRVPGMLRAGLFCGYTGLFCGYTGLFCACKCCFCEYMGLFSEYIYLLRQYHGSLVNVQLAFDCLGCCLHDSFADIQGSFAHIRGSFANI